MSLRDVERKIYRREENQGRKRALSYGAVDPHEAEENPFAPASFEAKKNEANAVWIKEDEEKKREKRKKIKKIALLSAVGLIVATGLVWAAIVIRKTSFSEDQVKLSISGPQKVQSGDLVSFDIDYQNLNRASLREAVLHINFPENFKPEEALGFESEGPNSRKYNVGTVNGRDSGKVVLKGKFFGPKDLLVYVDVSLEYSSSNFSSKFKTESKTGIFISSSPLFLETSGPQSVVAGNLVSYSIKFRNSGQEEIQDLKIKVDYPGEFSYISSEPIPSKDNNVWYVGGLGAGQDGEIKFNGTLDGRDNETKKFKIAIGEFGIDGNFIAYNESESNIKIVTSPIKIEFTINDKKNNINVNAGDFLGFKIKYLNTSTIGLRDVVLVEEFKSPILDYAKIDMSQTKGSLDSSNGTITWKAADIPGLKTLNPGEGGEISLYVPVKSIIPVKDSGNKNFAFNAVAKLDSIDISTPEGSNKMVFSNAINVKLNSKLGLSSQGYYNDSEIKNSGPIPLEIGKETTFTMHLKLMNVSNDLTDAKVTMALSPGVKWKNVFSPENADVSYNERSNELVWNIGTMPAGIGILTDPRELVFQIGVIPNQNQVGKFVNLLGKSVFSAEDVFTKQKLEAILEGKDSNLLEDMSVGNQGQVAQ
ncbi:MAG: hypothetical protein Q8L09_05235 [Candidatus Moranbacteria bacterium]|nr:hypothetical protein [Candidatus Moranbacteria bacterium]